jgi:hypothetical protein
MKRPRLSIVVILYNMRREAQRTLHSLSCSYQQGVRPSDYDVHVVENGSSEPVDAAFIRSFGPNFYYHRLTDPPPSPAFALNYGVAGSRGEFVGLMIDGAHLLTSRVVNHTLQLVRSVRRPIIAVRRFYLGPGQQPETVERGYNQTVEDDLLARIGWPGQPDRLFEIGAFMGKKRPGWFGRFWESNCLFMPRRVFRAIGGCDERFDYPGGGFLNLDIFRQAVDYPGTRLYVLLGEGSFHQVHGGTTTNRAPAEVERQLDEYHAQYEAIRGQPYCVPRVDMEFFGALHPRCFLV